MSDLLGELSGESDLDDLKSKTKQEPLAGGMTTIVAAYPERKTVS
ncbi:MAG: hypothetical protein AB1656_11315 [Candidatus Omnitrophota bacterium]